ncbi:tyrosine-type recombinase/integrase [Streptomyces kronopolitis]|uniref:tyrosine-type recombinase/integrase n=1 Tax=Streptomyces kronopolitis TaxID=1612435 RepID=UPI0020C07DFB|nr:tyrosine-type recombinase/integrase [Streptomyces kronopolitis]MCL6300484.1 tyrosine-type recombinase/integrase [Streptomyces kronopolitis]
MTDAPGRSHKAGNGEDSIYWDKSKNRYVGAVSLGYGPTGKRNRPKVSGKTKTEVRRKLRDLKRQLDAGMKVPATYTVDEAVTDWLARGLKGREASSIETYRSLARCHVTPDLGRAKLRELEADLLDDWLDDKAKILATQSLNMIHSILRRSITHAQRRGKVLHNVAALVEVPEGRPGRPSKSLTLNQAENVLRAQAGSWTHAYVVLSLLVGVRTEEARPLTWTHVHTAPTSEAPPHVDVWRSVRRGAETKTRKSRRSLAMPLQAATVIAAHRERQRREFKEQGKAWTEQGLVFPGDTGEVRTALNVRRNLRRLLKEAGFETPHEWTTRELRTSFVSLLSDHGIPIEVIARVVGHSGSSTTERVYRKQLRPVITDGAEAMDTIFRDGADASVAHPQNPA